MENKKTCQSCGMEMMKIDDFGNNSDGTINKEYCRICFRNGKFEDENVSMEKIMEATANEMSRIMKIPIEKAREDAKGFIPHLSRWKDCNMEKKELS